MFRRTPSSLYKNDLAMAQQVNPRIRPEDILNPLELFINSNFPYKSAVITPGLITKMIPRSIKGTAPMALNALRYLGWNFHKRLAFGKSYLQIWTAPNLLKCNFTDNEIRATIRYLMTQAPPRPARRRSIPKPPITVPYQPHPPVKGQRVTKEEKLEWFRARAEWRRYKDKLKRREK